MVVLAVTTVFVRIPVASIISFACGTCARGTEPTGEFLSLPGHTDTITGLQLSPDGHYLLSNSMDNTLRTWDVRPFVAGSSSSSRNTRIFTGHSHGADQSLLRCDWSPDSSLVTCGSSDRRLYVWNAQTTELLYQLGGHSGTVNACVFHPFGTEAGAGAGAGTGAGTGTGSHSIYARHIVASASTDGTVWLGELEA